MIPFAEWLPDQPDLGNPGSPTVKNVRPHSRGYRPLPSLEVYSSTVPAYPRGGTYARDWDANWYTYVGDETSLYSLVDGGWTEVSSATSAYTCGSTDYWEFAQWDEQIIATNFANDMQALTVGASTFATLGGTPPKARHIAVVRNFLVAGNTNDATDGNVANRVRWSGADDITTWTVSAATQADYEDLYGSGGWVQRVFGGEYGVVFQERSAWRMTYVGSPSVFSFDEVAPAVGLLAPGGAAQDGDQIFYLGNRGFEVLLNGSRSEPIGSQKIDREVLGDIDRSNLHRVRAAIDAEERHFYFSYPGADASDGAPNRVVIYDWSVGRWSYAEVSYSLFLTWATPSVSLEGLDTISGSDLDALEVSLDSPAWKGGSADFGAFNSANELGTLSGTPETAMIDTAEVQLSPGRRTLVSAVRPLVQGGTTTIQIGHRNLQSAAVTWTATATTNANGRATLRKNARYHRFRATITGEWEYAMGVEPDGQGVGWR